MHVTRSAESHAKEIIISVSNHQNTSQQISIIPEIFIHIISKLNVIDTLQCSFVCKAWNNCIRIGSSMGIIQGIKEIQKSNVEIKALEEEIKKTKYSGFRTALTRFTARFARVFFEPFTYCALGVVPLYFAECFLAERHTYQASRFEMGFIVLAGGAIISGIAYKIFSNLHQKEKAKKVSYNSLMHQINTTKLNKLEIIKQ